MTDFDLIGEKADDGTRSGLAAAVTEEAGVRPECTCHVCGLCVTAVGGAEGVTLQLVTHLCQEEAAPQPGAEGSVVDALALAALCRCSLCLEEERLFGLISRMCVPKNRHNRWPPWLSKPPTPSLEISVTEHSGGEGALLPC